MIVTGPDYLTAPALLARHGFFTRRGGVSEGPYASLNASLSGGDDPARVRENRRRIAAALGVAPTQLIGVRQVHGTAVITADAPWPEGAGAEADALVSARPGLALGVVTADCAPVLFFDPATGIAGAAHAGWRGAAAGVLEATLAAMGALGAARGRILAAIGPCIAQASYEVAGDLHAVVAATRYDAAQFLAPARPGHWQFDLAGYCAARLRAAGAVPTILGHDTFADSRFYSHRRRTTSEPGPIGHQLSVIVAGQEGAS